MGVAVLLDTHALLWALTDTAKLGARSLEIMRSRDSRVLVSAASAWEIATKHRLGKLPFAANIVGDYLANLRVLGAEEVAIESQHALLAGRFDVPHRDPFDRMIAAQATMLEVPLMTDDPAFAMFPCHTTW